MRITLVFLAATLFACQSQTEKTQEVVKEMATYPTIGSIEVFDSALYNLIAADAKIEILAEGFTWSEGPVWIEEIESLLFSDVPENRIWRWSESDSLNLFLEPSGLTGEARENDSEPGSNGLFLDNERKLVLCQHGDRRIARFAASFDAPKPIFETLADKYDGKRFNSPNDLVFDKKGNCYFTDPPYGLPLKMEDPTKEIDFQGVYRINTDGSIDLIIGDMSRPNGIELSNDEKTLYVANSDPNVANWMAYELQEDGSVSNARVFYDATELVGKEGEQGLPDGFVVAENKVIYASGPGGIWVFDENGKALGKIRTLQATSNCTLDKKRNILYMTADSYLMRLKLK